LETKNELQKMEIYLHFQNKNAPLNFSGGDCEPSELPKEVEVNFQTMLAIKIGAHICTNRTSLKSKFKNSLK
jgi:hypothetical protein